MRDADANGTSDELGDVPVENTIVRSVNCVGHFSSSGIGHDGWCALKSPRIRVSAVVRRFFNLSLWEVFPDQIVYYADDGCLEKAIDL